MKKNVYRCGNIRILLLLCLFVSIQATTLADIVKGRIVDAETKEPIPEAMVKYTQILDGGVYSIITAKVDSSGMFTFSTSGRGTIDVSMLGYHTKSKPVLAFGTNKDTLNIGTIELKISPQMLKMVEVSARTRRFTIKGDTIVFHPEAFHLQEGTRLDELIKQLPGVQVDNKGKLSWNGKPIRITMDGESIFGGDDLIKQLPAEAVENIKAYNKQSEFSERTGKDDGAQDMVLDLTVKQSFLDRWYGDAKAYYQSPKYYEVELRMNRLSKTDPLMVFVNANNINKHWRRNMNGGSAYMNNGFGQEHGASAGYQHNWQHKEGTHELKSFYSFTGGLAHDDDWQTSGQLTENFLPNTAVTRTTSENYQHNHKLEPRINANMKWVRDSLNTIKVSVNAEHIDNRSHSHQTIEQSEVFGSGYVPILSQLTASQSDGRETKLNTIFGWEHYVKDGSLGANVHLNYQNGENSGQTERTITGQTDSINSSYLIQNYTSPTKQFSTFAEIHHARWLTKTWMIQAQYSLNYNRNRSNRNFATNGTNDAANSYHNLYTRHEHNLNISQTINLTPIQLMPKVSARWLNESQDYQRGILDTAAVRSHFYIDPSLRATWKLSKTSGFELNYNFTTKLPDILKTIGYRDLTDPLFITEGNSNLRNTHNHDVKLTFNTILARSQTSFSTTIGYNHNDRETTNALSYTPESAVYTSRPENVRGGKSWNFHINLDQSLGDYLRLKSDFHMNTGQRYGFLILLPGQTKRIENRLSNLNPAEKLTLSLDYNWLKASVYAELNADRLRYTASPDQNATHWNNNFGLTGEATFGNFVIYTNLTERTNQGYSISSMNRNILLWNGAIVWKVSKNKVRLMLEFNDILNNEDGRRSEQSAYQQISSWRDFRHHFVGFSFSYHWDAKRGQP